MSEQTVIWKAQPKQAIALSRPEDELFYGGAKGGGKSDFLEMDYFAHAIEYGKASKGILFRETLNQLEDLIVRSHELYEPFGWVFAKTEKIWSAPNGAKLKMRYLERPEDVGNYWGHSYCVAKGTKIKMANGTVKKIEDIKIGNKVITFSGAKAVTNLFKPKKVLCVEVKNKYGRQVNPITHPILTISGWQSYASLLGKDSKDFEGSPLGFLRLPVVSGLSISHKHNPYQDKPSLHLSTQYRSLYRSLKQSLKIMAKSLRSDFGLSQLFSLPQLLRHYTFLHFSFDGIAYDPSDLQRVRDFQDGHPPFSHFYGEQFLDQSKISQENIPLKDGLFLHNHEQYKRDVQDSIPSSNHIYQENHYSHPYSGKVLSLTEENSYEPFSMSPLGLREVFDITVEDVNHYISNDTHLSNKNSWIGFDELTEFADDTCYMHMMMCLRSPEGVPCYMRASGNPGRVGHLWVFDRFINVAPPMVPYKDVIKLPSGKTKTMTRIFIPASLEDNERLMDKDPDYEFRLELMKERSFALYQAYRHGRWDVVVGAAFEDLSIDVHRIDVSNLPESLGKHKERLLKIFDFDKMTPKDNVKTFRGFDWGYACPYSVGHYFTDYENRLYRYREMYGAQGTNKGISMPVRDIARKIKGIEELKGERISLGIADSIIWEKPGSQTEKTETLPSKAETMADEGVYFDRELSVAVKKSRYLAKAAFHDRLRVQDDGLPSFFAFSNNKHFWRTVPVLPLDPVDKEDVDHKSEAHVFDEVKSICAARPYKSKSSIPKEHRFSLGAMEKRLDDFRRRLSGRRYY